MYTDYSCSTEIHGEKRQHLRCENTEPCGYYIRTTLCARAVSAISNFKTLCYSENLCAIV